IAALMGAALLAGVIDAMAGGGGLLTLPALLAAGIPPVAAIATNKLQSTLGTGGALLAFARRGHVDLRRFALPVAGVLLGSAAGACAIQWLDATLLAALVPLLLVGIALYFLFAPRVDDSDRRARLGPLP